MVNIFLLSGQKPSIGQHEMTFKLNTLSPTTHDCLGCCNMYRATDIRQML